MTLRARSTLIGLLFLLVSASAWAARLASVDIDGTEMYGGPGKQFPLIQKLNRGTLVTASNLPIQGFFKVRLSSGAMGWVQADTLVLQPVPKNEAPAMGPPGAVLPSGDAKPSEPEPPTTNELRLFAGMDLYSFSDLNTFLNASLFNSAFHFGIEYQLEFTPAWFGVVRLERLFKTVVGTDATFPQAQNVQFSLGVTPFMIGVEHPLLKHKDWTFGAALLIGLGLGADFLVSAPDSSASEVSGTAFSALLRGDAEWKVADFMALYGSLGLRFLRASSALPTITGTGAASTVLVTGGTYVPLAINMSGIELELGVSFLF